MKIIFPMQTVIGKMEETRVNVDFNEERKRGEYEELIKKDYVVRKVDV